MTMEAAMKEWLARRKQAEGGGGVVLRSTLLRLAPRGWRGRS